ncbi:hypothetical protein [Pseudoalteromonas sp. JB197]|uniref:hypothetical protein n=1 Tax=Pseudoalteromonas sp. JB197 TaxID=1434839 RepID=UPI00097F2ED9|nr:hypothetical protein [Pseudoalteromonas sp. JB197]SJN39151.1 hypothetical protein CZ797_09360 [Pseudoalteromonas sp. JB197]
MALLAGLDFHFDLDFEEVPLKEAEQYLEELTSKYANLIFDQHTKIYVRLQEGSLKVTLAVVGALYIGIGQYGSFRSGIDYMIKDAKSLMNLVTSEIVKNGMSEADIIEKKKMHCDPDKIRRVLLAIDRLESKPKISKSDLNKELSKIRTSVRNICSSLSEEDAGFFAISIKETYWPQDREIPHFVERYKLVAREEDIVHYPVASIEQPRVNKALQRTIR